MHPASKTALRRARRNSSAGFSLIELMVVIVIIGVLGASAVVIYQGITGDAKSARAGDEIKQMANAVAQYRVKFDKYPESLEALSEMKVKTPEADPWGKPYEYHVEEDGFSIRSEGEKAGEEDDIYWDPAKNRVVMPGTK
jgi:general secretion pathway protein G